MENIDYKEIVQTSSEWTSFGLTFLLSQTEMRGSHNTQHFIVTSECFSCLCLQRNRGIREHFIKIYKSFDYMTQYLMAYQLHTSKKFTETIQTELSTQKQLVYDANAKVHHETLRAENAERKAREEAHRAEEERKAREIEIAELERKHARHLQLPAEIKLPEPTEYIYVMASIAQAKKCRFKVGGSEDAKHLYKRYKGYFTGCDPNDLETRPNFFLIERVYNFRQIENSMKSIYGQFVITNEETDKDTEMYRMDFPMLRDALTSIIRKTEQMVLELKTNIADQYGAIKDRQNEIPARIDVEQYLGIAPESTVIDLEKSHPDQKKDILLRLFEECIAGRNSVSRKKFGDYVNERGFTFNKDWPAINILFGSRVTYK